MNERLKYVIALIAAEFDDRFLRSRFYHRIMMSRWWSDDPRALLYRKAREICSDEMAHAIENDILYGENNWQVTL